MYDVGIFKNLELAREIFPEWECWVYVPSEYHLIDRLKLYDNCFVFEKQSLGFKGLQRLWRFLPFFDETVEIVINRDCDARLTYRDRNIVNIFEGSSYSFQILQDHELHFIKPVLAGMNGCKPKNIPSLYEDYMLFVRQDFTNDEETFDEIFLAKNYHKILPFAMICNDKIDMEKTCEIGLLEDKHMFIGNKFDENDNPCYVRGY